MKIWTIKKILDWTDDYFKIKNITQPRLSAELLLASILNFSRMQLYLNYSYVLKPSELKEYKQLILKRLKNMPIQYILNEAYFRDIKLYVDEKVLIPRPETELVVGKALSLLKEISKFKISKDDKVSADSKKKVNILEIGTGSGAILISIAKEIKDTQDIFYSLIATEKSSDALGIAKKNLKEILGENFFKKIKFYTADIIPTDDLCFTKEYEQNINLIISNPPYVSENDYQNLPPEIKEYEPKSSLVGGKSGLEVYDAIFSRVLPFISKDICYMVFEISPEISEKLVQLAGKKLKYKDLKIEKDYNQKDRILVIRT